MTVGTRVRITDETTLSSAAVDVLSPSEAWQAIISARADASQQQQPIALVDTHGHPYAFTTTVVHAKMIA
eukprot:scaffold22485_cov149-Skeletonema_marinoi.AAC.2